MADSNRINLFKQGLLSQGINLSDNEIENYITLFEASNKLGDKLNQPVENKPRDVFSEYRPQQNLKVAQEDKNALWDFTGNLLWEAMDSATFGALEYSGIAEGLEESLVGEGPEGFAGRAGAGLGSFAGFLVPFKGVSTALGKGAKAVSSLGPKNKVSQLVKEGTEYLGKPIKAGQEGYLGYKMFNRLSDAKKAEVFKPYTDTIVRYGNRINEPIVRDAYIASFQRNLKPSIAAQLKNFDIPVNKQNVEAIEEIIKNVSGVSKKSTLPIADLEGLIANSLGGTLASRKTAAIAATALAEGVTFAAVELPFEFFHSQEEGRDADYMGTAAHAFALGNVLGLIKYVPGGQNWRDGGIVKTAIKRWPKVINNRRPYKSYNMDIPAEKEQIQQFAEGLYDSMGSQFFNKMLKNNKIYHLDDISRIMAEKGGADDIMGVLQEVERQATKKWIPEFMKKAALDLKGSSARMLMGSMAFNYQMVFDENIPMEDKVFHTLLGAFMTKKGRTLDFVNRSGGQESITVPDATTKRGHFNKLNEYLSKLDMDPVDYNLNSNAIADRLLQKMPLNVRDTEDTKAIEKIIKPVVLEDMGPDVAVKLPRGEKGGVIGDHPLYEYLQIVYDRQIGRRKGTFMKPVDKVPKAQIEAIEKKLSKYDFLSVDEAGGITKPKHIDNIFLDAADGTTDKLVQTTKESVISMYNHLAKGKEAPVELSKDKSVLTEVNNIISVDISGKKLTEKNARMLEDWQRAATQQDGWTIKINKDNNARLNVTNEDFKGLDQIMQRYRRDISQLVYGENKNNIPTTRYFRLAEEGTMYELIKNQLYYKGTRNIYEKLNDLQNSKGLWKTDEGAQRHRGEQLHELLVPLLYDKSGNLYTGAEFKGVSASNETMIRTLLDLHRANPKTSQSLLEQQGEIGKYGIHAGNKDNIKRVREILDAEGMLQAFTMQSPDQKAMFLRTYTDYAQGQFFGGILKRNGKPLNTIDNSNIAVLLESGFLGKDFQLVDEIGVINEIGKLADNKTLESITLKNDQLSGFTYNANKFAVADLPTGFRSSLKELKDKNFITSEGDGVRELLKTYKEYIEPYMVDAAGNGFIRKSNMITQMYEHELRLLIEKFRYIKKVQERTFHDELIGQLKETIDGPNLSDKSREQLSQLYGFYQNNSVSTSKIIGALAQKKLFRFGDQKLEIDPNNPTLYDQIREINADIKYDLAVTGSGEQISKNIEIYKGREQGHSQVDVFTPITKDVLIREYNLPNDIDFTKTNKADIVENAYKVSNVNSKEVKKYFKEGPGRETMNSKEKEQFILDLTKVRTAALETKIIKRLEATEGYGVYTDFEYKAFGNQYFNSSDMLAGEGKWSIVDNMFTNNRGGINDINIPSNYQAKQKAYDLIYQKEKSIDTNYRPKKDIGTLAFDQSGGAVVIEQPGVPWRLAVNKSELTNVVQGIRKHLDAVKKEYSDPKYNFIHKGLEKEFNKIASKEKIEKGEEWQYKSLGNAMQESSSFSMLMRSFHMDRILQKTWWDHLVTTSNGKDPNAGVKLARRLKMYSNTSLRRLSVEQLDEALDIYKKYGNKGTDAYQSLNELKKQDGKTDIIVVADEILEARSGGQGNQFSLLKEYKKQLDASKKNAGEYADRILSVEVDNNGKHTFANGGDLSKVDSWMIVHPNRMKAFYTLNGAGNIDGLGGIKPMIHKTGSTVILGKTAFVVPTDRKGIEFLENNNIQGMLVESASKIKHDNVNAYTEFTGLSDLYSKKQIGSEYKQTLELKDISLGFTVNSEHKASLPYQTTNHLSPKAQESFFNYYLAGKLDALSKNAYNYLDAQQPVKGLSYAKYLSKVGENPDPTSFFERWIGNNGFINTSIVMPEFIKKIKSRDIDRGILTIETPYGGQSVASPGIGLRHSELMSVPAKNQTGFGRENSSPEYANYTFGQGNAPHVSGEKPINLKNLHLIEHNYSKPDRLIHYSEIKDIKVRTGGREFTEGQKLTEANDLIKAYNTLNGASKFKDKQYEIAMVYRRNPSTRPNDMIVVGLNKVLRKGAGNQSELNHIDFQLKAEGDHDIDKMDHFWDAPTDVIKEWANSAGFMPRVNPHTAQNKVSLKQPNSTGFHESFDWMKQETVSHYHSNIYEAQRLLGTVQKTQRLLKALEHYTSFPNDLSDGKNPIKGFAVDLSNLKGGGMLYLDPNKLQRSRKLLAEDIQNVTDALTGFDSRIYNDNWLSSFLFGKDRKGVESDRYEGIFSRAEYNQSINRWTPSVAGREHRPGKVERSVIEAALGPYRGMLQLGTNLFNNGKKESVQYDNFLSGMRTFDSQMNNLSKSIHYRLKKQGSAKTGIEDADLQRIFFRNNEFHNILGEFGTSIRPNLYSRNTSKEIKDQFTNLLPFERSMAILARSNPLQLESPSSLHRNSEMTQKYHEFFNEYMYETDFSKISSEFINRVNKNDKFFGYVNYLDGRIRDQKKAINEAYQKGNKGYAERLKETAELLTKKKESIEDQMIYGSSDAGLTGSAKKFAQGIRDNAMTYNINNVYQTKKLPNDWNRVLEKAGQTLKDYQKQQNFNGQYRPNIDSFVAKNQKLFQIYTKNSKVIKIKGITEGEQLDKLVFHNMYEKFGNMGFWDRLTNRDLAIDMDKDVADLKKFYRDTWRNTLDGSDWSLNSNRSSALINDKLDYYVRKWDKIDNNNFGLLFLNKLMTPETLSNEFSYFNGRITPSFKAGNLNMIRLGLRYIHNSKLINSYDKNSYFENVTTFFNNSYLAAKTGSIETSNHVLHQLSNMSNLRTQIFRGSPLVDDIRPWRPGFSEIELNDNLAMLFGDNRSLTGVFANSVVDPSIIGKAANQMAWSYTPVGYVPENMRLMDYPSINGLKSYREALQNGAKAMLGNGAQLRILFNRTPMVEKNAFNNIQGGENRSDKGGTSWEQKEKQRYNINCNKEK